MTTNHKNFVCEDCNSDTYNNRHLELREYVTCYLEEKEYSYLCPNCADFWGLLERDRIFEIIGSNYRSGTPIEFSELVELCANILPFDIEDTKGYDDPDDEEAMEEAVSTYLQYVLQFYKIYLEIGYIKVNVGYDMFLKLHTIPTHVHNYQSRYYHNWNPLVRWNGAENFKFKTNEGNPFNSFYCFEYEGVNFYVDPDYFEDYPYNYYTCECGADMSPNKDPLDILKEYANKDDILIKE